MCPEALTHLLSTASNKRATYVALSPDEDRYYVGFENESANWRSKSDKLTEWIQEADREDLKKRIAEKGARKREQTDRAEQHREVMMASTSDVNMDSFLTAG